ncbi:Alpha/Beta hydrolase protein [Xylariales sp. PMI_506]|nr:Alpha/Beta hydrolase protein [Xylariales sp. PMI_506]
MATGVASTADHLVPDDPRVQHLDTQIGSYNYHYMLYAPENPVATVLLVHGWPDLGMAWRYQVPFLASLGLRVIIPDMLGYAKTSAPADYKEYSFKNLSVHMKALVEHVCGQGSKVILGGHDWGGAAVWRMAMWQPDMTLGVFSLNVPYLPPQKDFVDLEKVAERIPSFKYQLQLASPVAENIVDKSPERLRQFLNALYGGTGPNGERAFQVSVGLVEENMDGVGPATLLTPDMVDYYHREYSRSGLHGPTNWYRTRRVNWEDELQFAEKGFVFSVPAMVMMGELDPALPPILANGMEKHFAQPLRKELGTGVGHWGMWENPDMVNGFIKEFIKSLLGKDL